MKGMIVESFGKKGEDLGKGVGVYTWINELNAGRGNELGKFWEEG